jgi:hypothetical protein
VKSKHALVALLVALALIPIGLSVGTFIVVPIALLFMASLPILGAVALSMVVLSLAREAEQAEPGEQRALPEAARPTHAAPLPAVLVTSYADQNFLAS